MVLGFCRQDAHLGFGGDCTTGKISEHRRHDFAVAGAGLDERAARQRKSDHGAAIIDDDHGPLRRRERFVMHRAAVLDLQNRRRQALSLSQRAVHPAGFRDSSRDRRNDQSIFYRESPEQNRHERRVSQTRLQQRLFQHRAQHGALRPTDSVASEQSREFESV